MLAVFDSGLGGLTVLREVRKRLPRADILYFADQAHVPYGDRTPDDLHRLLRENLRHMEALGARAVVMGCNTSCAVAATLGWPESTIPVLDLIDSAAAHVATSGARRIAVLATNATAASGAYGNAIRRHAPSAVVIEAGTSELVPLVEAGITTGPAAVAAVTRALAPFPAGIDAIVLACTHFPFLDALFANALGPHVRRIDPATAQADRATTFAATHHLTSGTTTTRYLTTADLTQFKTALTPLITPTPNTTIESQEPIKTP